MGIIKKLKSSELVSVSVYSGISTVIKIFTSFVSAKIIAVYLGPAGLGMLGQLTSFITIFLVLSTGAITNGVIKFVSEFKNEEQKQNRIIKAAIQITLVCSLVSGVVIALGSAYWSKILFGDSTYAYVFIIFGITVVFYAFFSLAIAVLNGLQQYKLFNIINVLASVVGLIFSISMVLLYGIKGALISAVSYQSVVFIILMFFIRKAKKFDLDKIKAAIIKRSDIIGLSKFSLMALVSAAAVPLVQIVIRKYLASHVTVESVGYYEGVNRLSLIYLSLITTTFSVYYLPKLSEAKNKIELRGLLIKGYSFILPVTFLLLLVTYLLRNIVIQVVFADTFQPMEAYFLPQLIGDFFKIASWLLAMQMIAKAYLKLFVLSEILFGTTLIICSIFLINKFNGIGAVYGYMINYLLYFVFNLVVFRKVLFIKK